MVTRHNTNRLYAGRAEHNMPMKGGVHLRVEMCIALNERSLFFPETVITFVFLCVCMRECV